MEKEALIRYLCVTLPGVDPSGIAFDYLKSIEATGLGVRVWSLGATNFGVKPWTEVSHLFLTPLGGRYINVVCAPPGLQLGSEASAATLSGDPRASHETVYKPDTALVACYTVGVTNVAILTLAAGRKLSEKEIETLKLYNAVVCPDAETAAELAGHQITSMQIPPNQDQLLRLFSGMTPP